MLSDMDALSFDGYTSYSDSSAPRTPSPRADLPYPSPTQIYDEEGNVGAPSGYRGSLLQELYGQEEEYHKQQLQQQHSQLPPTSSHPIMPRRATFPYVRHDAPSYPPTYDVYEESYTVVPSNGPSGPTSYYQTPHNPYLQQHQQSSQHHLSYGPSSSGMLPASNMGMGGMPGMPMGPYGHLHPVPPVQHTDDAASKETQYLRRRCFNCHTTEPPSWRRSTLNPGKIVCNKCGLYERTHLRPRPLRFDELRAGGKSRKNSLSNGSGGNGKTSPKSPGKSVVKKESVDVGLGRIRGNRRSSVSSSAGSGSDWDDNGERLFLMHLPTIFHLFLPFLCFPLSFAILYILPTSSGFSRNQHNHLDYTQLNLKCNTRMTRPRSSQQVAMSLLRLLTIHRRSVRPLNFTVLLILILALLTINNLRRLTITLILRTLHPILPILNSLFLRSSPKKRHRQNGHRISLCTLS